MESEAFPTGWASSSQDEDTSSSRDGIKVDVVSKTHICCAFSVPTSSCFTIYANGPIPCPETAESTLYYFEVEFAAACGDGREEKGEGDSGWSLGIGLARVMAGDDAEAKGVFISGGVTVAMDMVLGECDGSISYYSAGMLRRGESGTGLEPALEVQYGSDFGTSDRVGCGWDVSKGTVFFTCNGTMMGLAASEYGLDHAVGQKYFPVVTVLGTDGTHASKVNVRSRFPLGFSSFRGLALEQEKALLKGQHFGWSMLTHNDHVSMLTEALVRKTRLPVEAFDRFIGTLERAGSSSGGEGDDPGHGEVTAELDQLGVGTKLLEAVLRPQGPEAYSDTWTLVTADSLDTDHSEPSSLAQQGGMGPQDTHLVRSVVARCRAMQHSLKQRIERAMLGDTSAGGQPGGGGSEQTHLARLLDLNGQLNKIYARMESEKEKGPVRACGSGQSVALPNVFSLICTVRSGSRAEQLTAAVTLASLAQDGKCRQEVLAAGGLHSLVHCVTSASSAGWADVQFQAAKAIARLVPGVHDLQHLLKFSSGILNALRLVLQRDPLETGSPQRSAVARPVVVTSEDERLSQRRLMVASALAHLAVTMQLELDPHATTPLHHHGHSSTGGRGAQGAVTSRARGREGPIRAGATSSLAWASPGDPPDKPLDALIGLVVELSYGRIAMARQGSGRALSEGQYWSGGQSYSFGATSREVSGGSLAGGGADPMEVMDVDEATVLAASAVSHLAGCEGCRVLLVNHRILPLLVSWLASHHKALQRHAACAVASLCSRRPELPSGALSFVPPVGQLSSAPRGLDVYTYGWIDAQILAEHAVTHLLPLANSDDADVRLSLAKALDNLSLHAQNRGAIVSAGGIGSLVLLLNRALEKLEEEQALAQHALASLFHLAMETGAETAEVTESSCYLIAKEGGLYPLVAFLQGPPGPLRLSAVSTIAMMSQHPPVRLAIFQANALLPLLAVGTSVCCVPDVSSSDRLGDSAGSGAPSRSGLDGSVSRRDEALRAKTEAIHVAYTLANLAHTQDAAKSYERRMIAANAIPVLLHIADCDVTEVVHQALRAIARLSGSLVRGFGGQEGPGPGSGAGGLDKGRAVKSVEETRDEQLRLLQANDTLRCVLAVLPDSNPYVQLEAIRTVAVLARVDDFRVPIVRVALRDLLRLAVDSSGERELCTAAQDALVSLGFEGGSKDLEFVGNDYSLLLHWFDMERALEDQKLALQEVGFALRTIMTDETNTGAPPHLRAAQPHRLTPATALTPQQQHEHGGLEASGGARSGLIRGAVREVMRRVVDAPEGRLRGLLFGTLQHVNCLNPGITALDSQYHDDDLRDVPVAQTVAPPMYGRSPAQGASTPTTARSTILSLLGCGPRGSSSGSMGGEDYSQYLDFRDELGGSAGEGGGALVPVLGRRRSSSAHAPLQAWPSPSYAGPLAVPEAGSVSYNLQKVLDRYFPSRLQQLELVPLTLYNGLDFRPFAKPDFRALLMPSRRYFSFQREGRVIDRIVRKFGSECDTWALCFNESSYEGEFCTSLLERLHRCPKVRSLCFAARPGSSEYMETDVAYLVGNLPVSVRHMSFDAVLSRPALQILGVVLRTKSSSHKLQSPGLALTGLAIRNHTHLRPEDFTPLLDFLRKDGIDSATGSAQGGSLGSACEEALEEAAGTGTNHSPMATAPSTEAKFIPPPMIRTASLLAYRGLKWLDLSGNKLGDGGCAEVVKALYVCHSIEALDLSGNLIKTASLFLDALVGPDGLTSKAGWLQTLLLDDNGLANRATVRLLGALQQDRSLHTLSLASNGLHDIKVAEACRSLLQTNRCLTDLNLAGNRLVNDCGRLLFFGLFENTTLRFLRLSGNSALGEETDLIKRQLVSNRRHFFTPPGRSGAQGMSSTGGEGSSSSQQQRAKQLRGSDDAALSVSAHPLVPPTSVERSATVGGAATQVMRELQGADSQRGGGTLVMRGCLCNDAFLGRNTHETSCPQYVQTLEHHRSLSVPSDRGEGLLGDRSGVLMMDGEAERLWHSNKSPTASPTSPLPAHTEGASSGSLKLGSASAQQEALSFLWRTLEEEGQQAKADEPKPLAKPLAKNEADGGAGEQGEVLSVLFSAPLAWGDVNGRLHAIEMLELEVERELLMQSFQEAGSSVTPRFDFATTERLRSVVTLGCRALHYSGHGHKNRLAFEDGSGGLQFVTMDSLKSLCGAGEHRLEFVFVSACHSRLAGQAFAEAGVAHVVCVNVDAQLADSAALAFTRAFYLALAVGSTVANAFDIGKQAVAAAPKVANSQLEGEKFLLLPEGQDHNVAIFAPRPGVAAQPPRQPDTWWAVAREHLPTPPQDFLGREVDMYRAISAVLNRRLITLLGKAGIGKTALAQGLMSYIALRRYLPDGIVLVRLEGSTTLEQLVQRIVTEVSRSPLLRSHDHDAAPQDAGREEGGANGLRRNEQWLFRRLRHLKVLLVLDHIDELQTSQDSLDLRVFLRQLFDQTTQNVKVLVTSSRSLDLQTLPGIGVAETIVAVGPLTLRNTVRLFARLCPHLHTAKERRRFLETLVIPDQADVTVTSRDITPMSLHLLERLGEGHPRRILEISYQMTEEAVLELLRTAKAWRQQERTR